MGRRLPVGFVLISSIPARAALLGRVCGREVPGCDVGMWHGAGVPGGQSEENPHTSFLIAKEEVENCGAVASSSNDHQSLFKRNIPPASVLGGSQGIRDSEDIIWGRRFVHLKHRVLGSLGKVMCALSLGKLT